MEIFNLFFIIGLSGPELPKWPKQKNSCFKMWLIDQLCIELETCRTFFDLWYCKTFMDGSCYGWFAQVKAQMAYWRICKVGVWYLSAICLLSDVIKHHRRQNDNRKAFCKLRNSLWVPLYQTGFQKSNFWLDCKVSGCKSNLIIRSVKLKYILLGQCKYKSGTK